MRAAGTSCALGAGSTGPSPAKLAGVKRAAIRKGEAGIWRDDEGYWQGWAEPVVFVALVEHRYYSRSLEGLTPAARRRFLREGERALEPVIYDVNSVTGYSTLSDVKDKAAASPNGHVTVISAAPYWEDVVKAIEAGERRLLSWAPDSAQVAAERAIAEFGERGAQHEEVREQS